MFALPPVIAGLVPAIQSSFETKLDTPLHPLGHDTQLQALSRLQNIQGHFT